MLPNDVRLSKNKCRPQNPQKSIYEKTIGRKKNKKHPEKEKEIAEIVAYGENEVLVKLTAAVNVCETMKQEKEALLEAKEALSRDVRGIPVRVQRRGASAEDAP